MNIEAIRKKLDKSSEGEFIGPFEIEIDAVRTDPTMQIRDRLDSDNLRRLRSAFRAGADVPPLLLAFIEGGGDSPVVIDGHHRLTVLETLKAEVQARGGPPVKTVWAKVARLTAAEARFQAALANNSHGLPLKPRESRRVFGAYVRAGRHRNGDGYKSYREIAKDLARDHKTIIAWMRADFPYIAAKMERPEKANAGSDGPPRPVSLLKHDIEAWFLEGRNLFEKGRSGDRVTLVEGLEALLPQFRKALEEHTAWQWDNLLDHAQQQENAPANEEF